MGQERPLPTGACDWDNANIMDYVQKGDYLDPRHFGALRVERQAMPIDVDFNSRASAYGTWKIQMLELHKPVVHKVDFVLHMLYLRDGDERDYVMMQDNVRRNVAIFRALGPAILTNCLLNSPHDGLFCLSWSKM